MSIQNAGRTSAQPMVAASSGKQDGGGNGSGGMYFGQEPQQEDPYYEGGDFWNPSYVTPHDLEDLPAHALVKLSSQCVETLRTWKTRIASLLYNTHKPES
jgi:hypothetical protein